MKAFANKTQFQFQPGLSAAFAADATGTPYTTPADLRERLGDLSRLEYALARFKGVLQLNQGSAGGQATVRLNDGSTDYASVVVDLSAGTELAFEADDIDLSNVAGSAALRVLVDIDTAADAGTTAQLASTLEVTHPLTIFGGC